MSWQRIKAVILATWSTPKFPPPPPGYEGYLPRIERAQVVTLSPGDALVVTCDQMLTPQQVARIKANTLADLPPGCTVAVLHGGLKVATVAQAQPVIPQLKPERGPIPHIPQPSPGRL